MCCRAGGVPPYLQEPETPRQQFLKFVASPTHIEGADSTATTCGLGRDTL
jgi:hypothetical protein